MNKTTRLWVEILTILVLIVGTVCILQTSVKVIDTSAKLFILGDNASFYNEQERKTDAMTEEYILNNIERQKIYNSDDKVVKSFSNQNIAVKLIILLVSFVSFIILPYMWIYIIIRKIRKYLHRRKRVRKVTNLRRKIR